MKPEPFENSDRTERSAFIPNEFYESLFVLRDTKPEVFAVLSLASKLALGHYEAAKRRAAMLAEDNQSTPNARKPEWRRDRQSVPDVKEL